MKVYHTNRSWAPGRSLQWTEGSGPTSCSNSIVMGPHISSIWIQCCLLQSRRNKRECRSIKSSDLVWDATVYSYTQNNCTIPQLTLVKSQNGHDPVLSRVYHLTLNGCHNYTPDAELDPYLSRKAELTIEEGCVLWDNQVTVPLQGRPQVIARDVTNESTHSWLRLVAQHE